MCYPLDIHPLYAEIRASIAQSADTICVLASLSRQQCIDLTVARQLARPFMQTTAERQTRLIGERFDIYRHLGAIQIGTDISPEKAVEDMLDYMANKRAGFETRRNMSSRV
jgi:shikimate kinase